MTIKEQRDWLRDSRADIRSGVMGAGLFAALVALLSYLDISGVF